MQKDSLYQAFLYSFILLLVQLSNPVPWRPSFHAVGEAARGGDLRRYKTADAKSDELEQGGGAMEKHVQKRPERRTADSNRML